ncbi:agamous-like MADS-box protein AGL80 [Gastrolobium bilobum]|uniref:agamous-like MADS-box protein AGL80 n=1 Tax=Gastrolobium bilobum TaxID=150636 RepID=UPI002AB06A07|nr:agamous-like MADS-box protein AGL80 [Gastrolobium bilobum]
MRKKVKLAFIVNDKARKVSYKKRHKGLLKKLAELTILCGVEACAIIYSPYESQPKVWPSQRGVQKVIKKFRSIPEFELSKRMLNQESFMKQKVQKAKDQLDKVRKDNREKEMSLLMFQYLTEGNIIDNLSLVDLNDLTCLINENLKEIDWRMKELNKKASTTQNQAQVAEQVVADGATRQAEEAQVMDHGQGFEMNMDAPQNESWILDWINGADDEVLMPFGDANYPKN